MTRSTGEAARSGADGAETAPGSREAHHGPREAHHGPRGQAKAERREQLLASAKHLFARYGFRAVRLGDIGKGAGVSGPAVYRHFASKEAVLEELLVGISEYLHEGGRQIIAEAGDARAGTSLTQAGAEAGAPEAGGGAGVLKAGHGAGAAAALRILEQLIDFHVDFAMKEPELIRIQDRDLDALPEDARRSVRRLQRQYVTAWVGAVGAAHPQLTEEEATVRVHALFGMVNSTPHLGRRLPAETVARELRRSARAVLGI
ncbi:TetR/AcrR family transcriptional regulator [Brevibacterium album]|uniref:TetR/AcrR family transcriptional regulator n=1 Tax=Brevibacterium album TaxID=417948 RepID=UPI000412C845|nr:TetR/AcrR family transcriptional regulator [Brevibacterium album]